MHEGGRVFGMSLPMPRMSSVMCLTSRESNVEPLITQDHMKHQLWIESDQEQTFCLTGPRCDEARSPLSPTSHLVWQAEASSHFESMTKCRLRMVFLGEYTTGFSEHDKTTQAQLGWK